MVIANIIAFIVLCIGGLNWGIVGIFNWNLVDAIFMHWRPGIITIYVLVLIATIWLIVAAIMGRGKIDLNPMKRNKIEK